MYAKNRIPMRVCKIYVLSYSMLSISWQILPNAKYRQQRSARERASKQAGNVINETEDSLNSASGLRSRRRGDGDDVRTATRTRPVWDGITHKWCPHGAGRGAGSPNVRLIIEVALWKNSKCCQRGPINKNILRLSFMDGPFSAHYMLPVVASLSPPLPLSARCCRRRT